MLAMHPSLPHRYIGPFLIHTDASGKVLESPVPLPGKCRFAFDPTGTAYSEAPEVLVKGLTVAASQRPVKWGLRRLGAEPGRQEAAAAPRKACIRRRGADPCSSTPSKSRAGATRGSATSTGSTH